MRPVLLAALVILSLFSTVDAAVVLTPPEGEIPLQYFGMHLHRAGNKTEWPTAPFGSWRLFDSHSQWPSLELRRGEWNFSLTDNLVSLAGKNSVELFLPLGFSPTWASSRPAEKSLYGPGNAAEPADIAEWKRYVSTVTKRYAGKVKAYEIWNEPNLKGFYTGTKQQLIQLSEAAFRIIKQADPSAIVVSPPPTASYGVAWLDDYLKQGGGKWADIIGYHFYISPTGPPEEIVPLVKDVRKVLSRHGQAGKPLWNTESGWYIQSAQKEVPAQGKGVRSRVIDQKEAAAYVVRSLIIGWACGLQRFYWYAWDNYDMGLVEPDGKTEKPGARAYGEVVSWLVGARMDSCRNDNSNLWTCTIRRGANYRGWILWSPDKNVKMPIPSTWWINHGRDIYGKTLDVRGEITVGPQPILLESR